MNEVRVENCKVAQLHKLAFLQSYGAMLVIDKNSHEIVACSTNIENFFGQSHQALIGQSWSELLNPQHIQSLFDQTPDAVLRRVVEAKLNGQTVHITNHSLGSLTYVELEPIPKGASEIDSMQRRHFVQKLSKEREAESAAELLMSEIARHTGFDRVMLYKFLPDWHGEVIAEVLSPGVDGYLGLRFPEGDIPDNARRLFTINLHRLIADVAEPTTEIALKDDSHDIDLSFVKLRAVHPVHIKYLKNMGVGASFSVSIVCEGKLWGMIACHHLSPKMLSINQCQDCEELTVLTAMHMADIYRAELERERYRYRVTVSELHGALKSVQNGFKSINAHINDLQRLFECDGVWQHLEGNDTFCGLVPDQTSLSHMKNWLDRLDRNQIYYRNDIPEALNMHPVLVKYASGLIYIPLTEADFMVAFRHEQIERVDWAGKPQFLDTTEATQLTPRSSFMKWSQEVRGKSRIWSDLDIESAGHLRNELLEFIDRSEMELMALKDPLTGLSNRLHFERKLASAVAESIETNQIFAICSIDLDNFKPVNDQMGHAAGDELLIQVGGRLQKVVRDNDVVARLGGDEFSIILNSMSNVDEVTIIATRLLKDLSKPFTIGDASVQIGASIGFSVFPLDAASEEELLREADVALYEVKKSGRNGVKRFDSNMLDEQERIENVRNSLLSAFENDEFELVFQKILDHRSGRIVGLEAFTIWNHPDKGKLLAKDFINQIRRNQLGIQWAQWGLRKAFSHYANWKRSGLTAIPISVNLNAEQFLNLDLVGYCENLEKEFQVDSSWLRLDIEECALIMSARRAEEKIALLSKKGILVNVDGFGQGLQPLKQLTTLKLNSLKVKGGMLKPSEKKLDHEAQWSILLSIGKVLKVPVVVTEIENDAMIEHAKALGIHQLQGYAVSELKNYDDTSAWLMALSE